MDRWRIKAAMGLVCILTVSVCAHRMRPDGEIRCDHNQDCP